MSGGRIEIMFLTHFWGKNPIFHSALSFGPIRQLYPLLFLILIIEGSPTRQQLVKMIKVRTIFAWQSSLGKGNSIKKCKNVKEEWKTATWVKFCTAARQCRSASVGLLGLVCPCLIGFPFGNKKLLHSVIHLELMILEIMTMLTIFLPISFKPS